MKSLLMLLFDKDLGWGWIPISQGPLEQLFRIVFVWAIHPHAGLRWVHHHEGAPVLFVWICVVSWLLLLLRYVDICSSI
jgi:hypothetical protein